MKKTLPHFRTCALLALLFLGYGFQSFPTATPPEQVIEFKGETDRFLVFISEELETVQLCGLKKDEEYVLNVIPANMEDSRVFTSFKNLGGMSYGIITAAAPCHTLVIETKAKKALDQMPVYVSVARKAETFSVKPFEPGRPPAISTSTTLSASQLVTDVLVGGNCFDVANVTSFGNPAQRGTFTNGSTSIGFNAGVILATGAVGNATGPNNAPNRTTNYGSNTSDPDLAQLTNGVIRDVSRIEFDFTPTADTVTFRYVFASEEYCEYANSNFNDVFGFFISGPGINGPFSNNAINIAVLPNGNYVSINNVNHLNNPAFYIPNIPSGQPNCNNHPLAFPPATQDCQYDGFTVVLTATAVVIPCSTYHIKLAVADVGDGAYDSAVFLEENSFSAGTLAGANAVGTVQGTNIIYEGCTGGYFLFTRDGDLSEPMTITFTITGTATPGVDYEPLPTTITIPAGQSQFLLPVNVFADGITEGIETIILNFALPCRCDQKAIEMQIHDPPPININLPDQELCGAQNVTLNPQVQGGVPGPLSYDWSTGATTSSITVNPPFGSTTYTVTVTDECGNSETAESTVTIDEIPTAALSGTGVICTQGETGPVDLTVTFTGSGPWQFVYSFNGQQTTVTTSDNPYILSISNPGSVQLDSVTSTTGNCPGTVSGNVTIPQVTVTANAQGLNPGCNGENTGSINLNVSGGTAPYTFVWSNGNTNQNPTGLGAGSYTVTATDANGCEQTATVNLTDPPQLNASATGTNPLCNGGNTGSINLSVSGGTTPYLFNWSNGNTNQNPTGLGAGSYTVTVTDANGCDETVTVTLSNPPELTASATGTDVPCNGANTGSISLTVGGGTTPYAFQWSNGNTSQNPTGLGAGSYTVTVTDANGCTETTSVTLSQPPQLTAAATGTNPLCNGANTGSINLTVGGGTPTYAYLWSNGTSNQNPTGLGAGSYTVTVTDANGCSQTTSVNLTNPPQINVTPQTVNPGCTGASTGSINVSVSNGTSPYLFNWSNGSSNQNQTGLSAGSYTVTVTDANGCTQIASANLNDPPQLNASVANTQQVNCNNPTGSITTSVSGGTPGYNYQWTPSGSGPNPVGLQPGTYTATVTDANGCTATISATITADLAQPNAAAAVSSILTCTNTTLSLNGAGSSTGPNFTYQWSGPGIVSGANTLTPTVNAPGTYTITVTNSTNGCTQTASVSVQQDIVPPIATGTAPPITCNNPSVSISGAGSSSGPNFTYQWTGPGITGGANTLTPTVNAPGNYTLTVTNSNNGCTATANVNVPDQTQLPVATGTAPPITCSNPAVSINGAGSSTGSNFSYQWTTTNGNIVSGTTTLNPVVNQQGTYTLTVTNTATGCQNTTSVSVNQNTVPPTAEAGPSALINCANSSVQLNGAGSSSGPGFNYFWTGPGVVSGTTTLTPTVNQPGTYTITVTNAANGCTSTDQVVVNQDITPPIANVLAPATITCAVTQIQLNGAGSSTGPNFSYNWTTIGGIIISGQNTLTPTVGAGGLYTLTVTNSVNACASSFSVVVPTNLTQPVVNAGPTQELTCVVNQVQLLGTGSSTGPNFTYQWSTPNGNIVSGGNTLFPVVNAPGSYTLTITNTTNGCVATASTSVIVDANVPIANAGQPATLTCTSPVVTLNGTGSSTGPNFSLQWTTTNGNILSGANTPTPQVNVVGQYQLTVTSLVNGCQSSSFVTVNQNIVQPTISILPPGEVNCFTPQITLDATGSSQGNMSYVWNTANGNIVSGQGTLNLVVDQGGTYILTIVDLNNGCLNGGGVTVVQNIDNPALAIATPNMVTCNNPQATLNTAGSSTGPNFQYTWTTQDGAFVSGQNGPAPVVSSGGTYSLTIFNQTNNCSSSGQVLVPENTVIPTIALDTPQGLNCTDLNAQLNATVGGGTGLSYNWTTTNGNIVSGQNTLQPIVNAPGAYQLLVVNPVTGCENADALTVVQDVVVPQAAAGTDGLLTCAVTSLQLDGTQSDSGPSLTYQWTTADGNIVSGAASTTPQIDAPGTYVLQVYNVVNTCQSFDTVLVDQDIVFPVAAAADPILMGCADPIVTLDGGASSSGSDIVYQWTTPNGNILSGATTLSPQVDAPGDYTLNVLNSFNGCASSTQLIVVQDIEVPLVDAGPGGELTCTVINIQLQGEANGQTNRFIYNWTTIGGNILSGVQGLTPIVNEAGFYTLTVVDTVNNCVADATVEITQDANVPQVDVAMSNPLNCVFSTVTLDGTGSSQGPSIVFEWTTPNGNFVSGSETLTPVVDMPGTYSLVITDTVNFCVTSQTVQVVPDTVAPVLTIASPDQLNCYQPIISINASAGGLPDINLSWSTSNGNFTGGQATLQPSVDQPGTYTLVVLNNQNGCSSQTQTLVDSDFAIPAADAGPQGIVNCEDTVLTLSGAGDGGGAPLAYLWETANGNILFGADTPNPQVDQGGLYSLTVTNVQNGCLNTASVQIAQDQIYPDADAGPQGLLNCYFPQIQLDGTGSSTGAQFAYQWTTQDGNLSGGANTLTPTVDAPGTYLLTVTNLVNLCVSTQEALVLDDFVAPQADAGPGSELTCSITTISLSGTGSQGSEFLYTWTTGDGNIVSGANTLAPLVDEPGVYDLEIFNQENGCSSNDAVTITTGVLYPVAAALAADTLTCAIGSVQLSGAGSDTGGNFIYNWSTPTGNIVSGASTLAPVVDAPGTYTLAVTNTNNDCVTNLDLFVPIDTIAPLAEAGQQALLTCAVQELQLSGAGSSAGPAFTYQWTTQNGSITGGTNTLSPTVNQPGNYQILVINQVNGCLSTDMVTVNQDITEPLALAAVPGILTCAVTSLNLNGTGSSSGGVFAYQWTTTGGNIVSGGTTLSAQVDQPGQYTLTVLNQFNGCSSAATVGVQQNIVDPVADAGASSILTCAVTSLALSGSASGNSSNLTYQWTTTGGNISSGANTLVPTVNQPGAYLLTVTDEENGCTAIDQVQIGQDIVPPAVIIASPGVLTCTQTEVAIDAMSSDAGAIFTPQWATSNGNILSGVQALNPLVNQPGLYSLTISNSENGCVATSSVQVTQDIVPPAVDAGDGFTLPCFEDIAYLQGSASAATGNLGLQWSTTNGQLVSGQNTLSPTISSGGTYMLFVVNQVNGCTASDEVVILENFPANPQYAPEQPLCYEDKGLIEILGVSGGTPPYVYSVNGGATFQSSPLFVNLNAGLYSIVVQDALGCETTPESQPIVTPNPVIVDLDGIVQLKLGESYQLQVLVNFPENEIQQITWTPSEGLSCDDCLTPTVTPTQSTQYRVEVIDQNGCYGTASVQFILDKRPAVFVPNIFSPNGDGENDVFFINAKPESVRQIKSFLVFSRWGESVFEYFNFQPNNPAYGWDGTHRGRPLDPAVFVWFAEIEFIDGRTELFEGGVTLIR